MQTLNLMSINFDTIIDEFLHRSGSINVLFDNGETVPVPVRKLILHLIFFKVGRKWGVALTPENLVDVSNVNSDTLSNIGTKILDAARKIHPVYHEIVFDFNDAMNVLNRFVINNCQEYHKSLSIVDLVRVANIPAIRAITDDKVSDPNVSIKEARKHIKKNYGKLFAELKKPHPDNVLRNFVNLRFVNETQLAHIFYQIGFRTDINDDIIRYPIQGNYLNGLLNVTEYCLESLSAKKAAFYSKDSLPNTEYFGRKQHILLSTIKYMYPGDCGTDVTMPLMITEKMRDKGVVLYKNIVEGSMLITLDHSNIDRYVGKIVNFRTPMACRHHNGICEACGGKLLGSITPQTHVGIFSAIQTTSKVTQVILGAKHVQEVNSVDYIIPDDLKPILYKNLGNIFVKPKLIDKFKDTTFVMNLKDTIHLIGLSDFNFSRVKSINEASFGFCKELVIIKNNAPISDQVCLEVNGQSPMYSKQFIKYISDHPEHVIKRDDMFMLNMTDFDFTNPLFKITVMNNSMVKFVNSAKKILENKMSGYTSATALVNDFTNLVYEQVHPNIVYLEVVLRAGMITSNSDYRLPIVTDIENVRFMTNQFINMRRSMGNLCAFEQLPAALENPMMYLMPKGYTAFDDFLCLKPRIGSL